MMRMQHLDSGQVAFLLRELEVLDKQAYEELLPGLLGMTYVPPQPGVPEWAEVYTYKMFRKLGQAAVGSKDQNALPRAGLVMTPSSRRIEQFPLAYGWTVREIQQAAATGVPLDTLTLMAARSMAATAIDNFIAKGNVVNGPGDIEGILTLSGVHIETPTTKTGGLPWITPGNTPDQALNDITFLTERLSTGLLQTATPGFNKFLLLCPTVQYAYIANTPRSTQSDTTILKFAIANNPWLESIEPWWQCNGAGAEGADRIAIYPRNPLAVSAIVPQEFRPLSPQEKGLEIEVPASASCGGVIARYEVAQRYMDGV